MPKRSRMPIVADPPAPDPDLQPSTIDLNAPQSPFSGGGGNVIKIENSDNSVTIAFNDSADLGTGGPPPLTGHDENLAIGMHTDELSPIASELLDGIEQDDQSRREWLEIRERGIKLLGLKIEEPRGDTGTSSAPVEGMSTVRHSLLTEACVAFQAGARAELLPSAGPIKIRNDQPPGAPATPPGTPPGTPGTAEGSAPTDELAEALQVDLNHYLTVVATEYVPDTDRMLFSVGFGGDGFKKLYHCPLRRRPVSESVDPEDLIVSNAATDLHNCGRVTQRIKMRKSVLRRMQLIGAYRDCNLQLPSPSPVDDVKRIKADIGGYRPMPVRPKDADYTIYECYVELDIDQFAPKHLKGKGLPLPYRVTIEKDSRQILEIRRNWRKEDKMCRARRVFVQYPFIRALGFYGLGFVHLLGNTVLALTAAMREMLDAGMFANFPGFIYNKAIGRQLTNQFRAPPGGGIPIDLPIGTRVQDAVMPMPYKEVGPAFPAFMQHVEQNAKQLAMVANTPVAEGKQDAPVGTTLALIEQQNKVVASAFKRMHDAQSEEFRLLRDLFREDPEAMWRFNPRPAKQWTKAQFLEALGRYELVPCADPNNPTSLHRMAKGALLKTLQAAQPAIYDPVAVDRRIMSLAGIDPEGLFKPPAPPQPDPVMMLAQARMQQQQMLMNIRQQETQLKALLAAQQQQGRAADRASRERIELLKGQIARQKNEEELLVERLKLGADMLMQGHQMMQKDRHHGSDQQMDMHNASVQAASKAQGSGEGAGSNGKAPPPGGGGGTKPTIPADWTPNWTGKPG